MGTHLEILDTSECFRLLESAAIGRVGVTVSALPEVLPVYYVMVDGDILFRTGAGTKLDAAARKAVVAFEVDGADTTTRSGWSVLVVGTSEEVTDPDHAVRALGLLPDGWVPGEHQRIVRLTPRRISGRRIVP